MTAASRHGAVLLRDGEVEVAGHEELELVVLGPAGECFDWIGTDGDQDYVLTAVENLRVLITVRVHLNRSATRSCSEEEGQHDRLPLEIAELDRIAQHTIARGARHLEIRRNGADFPRAAGRVDAEGHAVLQQWEDVVELNPLDRKEVVLPMRRPPEVLDPVWDARDEDWEYPMHCHAEPSQTAAGGMYPGGLVAHWTLKGPNPGVTQ